MKPHQIIARRANLDNRLPDSLSDNVEAIKFIAGLEKDQAISESEIEAAYDEGYDKGADLGAEAGKGDCLEEMSEWFADIDEAGREILESLEAEFPASSSAQEKAGENTAPMPVKIALDKFKSALDEFEKKMNSK